MLNKLTLGLVMAFSAAGVIAQTISPIPAKKGHSAYVEDSHGNIMRTPFGHCWRSALWTPADAVAGCDGDLLPPVANPTAPALVANPAPVVTTTAPTAVAPAARSCDFVTTLKSDSLFQANGSALTAAGKKQIEKEVLAKLAGCKSVEGVQVKAPPAGIGANHKLPGRRASAVAAYLTAKGVPGATVPSVDRASRTVACARSLRGKALETCRATHRKIEIVARGLAG